MRFGSGSERRRCIMQFSLAAGSESAAEDGENVCETDFRSSALVSLIKHSKHFSHRCPP